MRITLRPKGALDGTADVVLSIGSDRSATVRGPSGASLSVSSSIQEIRPIRAEFARFAYRKNRSGSYQFTASRIFASLAEAGRFILVHGSTCPMAGTLIFDWSDLASDAKVVLLGCVLRQIGESKQTGLHVSTSYSVQFSQAKEVMLVFLQDEIDAFYYGGARARKINCGGPAIGEDWEADTHYDGSSSTYSTESSFSGNGDVPEAVYRTCRGNNPAYSIPLPPGVYNVKIHFGESVASIATGARVFHIQIAGETRIPNYDIKADVGALVAVVKTFEDIVHPGGDLVIRMLNVKSAAIINGIETIPTAGAEE